VCYGDGHLEYGDWENITGQIKDGKPMKEYTLEE
jgi:hypothetical protein